MQRVCLIGLEEKESQQIREASDLLMVVHDALPRFVVQQGQFLVERRNGPGFLPVDKVVFHGIYEEDMDFITALALWGGPCLPNARAMMDCRLKLPCLVRALQYTRFGTPARGFASAEAPFSANGLFVAKWGNWHCGENKERFDGYRRDAIAALIEPFIVGESVRVVIIGDAVFQIRLEGTDWRKSIHDNRAVFMDLDPELVMDTQQIKVGFGLEIIGNDYIVTESGTRHLLEVNHIPNVTRFPEIWQAYRDFVLRWIQNA